MATPNPSTNTSSPANRPFGIIVAESYFITFIAVDSLRLIADFDFYTRSASRLNLHFFNFFAGPVFGTLPQERRKWFDGFRLHATICSPSRMECTSTSWEIRVTNWSARAMGRTMLASWRLRKSTIQTTCCDSTKTSTPTAPRTLNDLRLRCRDLIVGYSELIVGQRR
jgi:hypothetical protein